MTKTLDELYEKLADHIKVHSPLLKAVGHSDNGVHVSDFNGEAKMVGRYYKVEVDEKTNDAWLKFLEQNQSDVTLVYQRHEIEYTNILWFPKWSQQMAYSDVLNYFTTICPPFRIWHEVVCFLEIPKEAIIFKRLGRKFYSYVPDDAILYVDKEDILRHCSYNSRLVLNFCLEMNILPERILLMKDSRGKHNLSPDNHVYEVRHGFEKRFLVLVSRDDPKTVKLVRSSISSKNMVF